MFFFLLVSLSSIYSIINNHHSHSHSLLLASHSLRSISLGSTTSSLRSKSTTRIFVNSGSKYCFFSSAGGFFPFGFVFDFLQHRREEDRLRKGTRVEEICTFRVYSNTAKIREAMCLLVGLQFEELCRQACSMPQ